mgnify:CR=1 FL=1|tara:strand:+ start:13022 stop:14770 length:1749 start_codon:yes stop_codon:yes gene_type:complete
MASSIKCSITSFTHTGNREENQDRYSVMYSPDQSSLLCLVADGMGGHKGGSLAAQTIIETAHSLWQAQFPTGNNVDSVNGDSAEAFLHKLVTECQIAVNEVGARNQLNPRSTLAALYIYQAEEQVQIVSIHAGDSRITQYSGSQKIQQSFDHSLAQLKVLQGKITEAELADDPDQGTVISNIGGEDPPDPEITHWEADQGNCFTVSSDGFWEIFSNEEVLALFKCKPEERETQIEISLLKKLKERPKHDNTTVIFIELSPSNQDSLMTNSDQDKNSGQAGAPPKEVEDPITNPGRQEPYSRSAADKQAASQATASNTPVVVKASGVNSSVIVGGIIIVIIVLLVFLFGSSVREASDGSQAQEDSSQSQGPLADGEVNVEENGEAGGEGSDAPPAAQESTANTNSEGAVRVDRVLDSVELQTDINVSTNEELIEAITDMLLLNDRLGPDDALSISTEAEANGNRIIRMQQTHQGIPVFGAEVVAVEDGGSVFNISGSTGNEIDIDVQPGLTFQEALAIANTSLSMSIGPRITEAARLMIIDIEGSYHLAWFQVLLINGLEERVFLDAQDGAILLRLPTNIGEA